MAWTLYKEIRYALDGIPGENLTDFSKLFVIDDDAEIAAELSSGGGVKVTSADGLTDLSFGLRPQTDLAAGTVWFTVKIPSLLTAVSVGDTMVRLYYSASESTTEDKSGAVSTYSLFMPLEEDPSGSAPQMFDWVSESNIGTSGGSMTSGDLVDAQVGKGLDFDGSDDVVNCGTGSAYTVMGSAYTIEAIVNGNSFAAQAGILENLGPPNYRGYYLGMGVGTANARPRFYSRSATHAGATALSPSTISTATNYAICGRYTGSEIDLFVNGTEVATAAMTGSVTGDEDLRIGYYDEGSAFWNGVVDEVAISPVARSANWLAYRHVDQFANADTFTLSEELGAEPGGEGLVHLLAPRHLILGGGFA